MLGTLVFYERYLHDLCTFDGFLNPSLCTKEKEEVGRGWSVTFSERTGACWPEEIIKTDFMAPSNKQVKFLSRTSFPSCASLKPVPLC